MIEDVVGMLEDLCDDPSVPRNVKARFKGIIHALTSGQDVSSLVNKALHDLDEVGDDNNLQPYIRTQIWNVASMLEKVTQ